MFGETPNSVENPSSRRVRGALSELRLSVEKSDPWKKLTGDVWHMLHEKHLFREDEYDKFERNFGKYIEDLQKKNVNIADVQKLYGDDPHAYIYDRWAEILRGEENATVGKMIQWTIDLINSDHAQN